MLWCVGKVYDTNFTSIASALARPAGMSRTINQPGWELMRPGAELARPGLDKALDLFGTAIPPNCDRRFYRFSTKQFGDLKFLAFRPTFHHLCIGFRFRFALN